MNCQRFEQIVSELARGQMMEAEVRTEALAHSEHCERCLARLRDEETLTRGLQLFAADMESLEAPAEIELKLREAFRERRVVAPVAIASSRSRYWLVAVAAVLLLAISVAAMWWRSETPQQRIAEKTPPKQSEVSGPGAPAPAPEPKEVKQQAENREPKRQLSKPIRRNTVNRRAPETPIAHHTTNEIATDFMPLGDMNSVMLQDGGQIIRVKLQRSALVKFGIPVNMDRYNENVKADVLIGVDGRARAIRFVQ
jgi:hypothetical protein